MAWFKKKEKKEESSEIPALPDIPQLPELPEFPEMNETKDYTRSQDIFGQIPQLPSFPNESLGNKFSQDTIKKAITGKREEEVEAEEFTEELPMTQKPLVREGTRRDAYTPLQRTKAKEAEPIFIRIDKFEEGSKTFEDVKKKISEIEELFEDIKSVKEKEEKELSDWENEIKQVKEKIEKIDQNIFSQIE
jgi:hypothetical protein